MGVNHYSDNRWLFADSLVKKIEVEIDKKCFTFTVKAKQSELVYLTLKCKNLMISPFTFKQAISIYELSISSINTQNLSNKQKILSFLTRTAFEIIYNPKTENLTVSKYN